MHIEKKTLPNGVRVIWARTPWTKAVTLLVLARVGSRYEIRRINGISHFIEHLMFKGTKKRPTTLHISRELDRLGAEYNAFTSKDHTGYYIKVAKEHFPIAADILFDMLLNSLFKEEEIERERKVIAEEIKMYEENPLMHIEDLFEETLYRPSTLGWNIAGTKETMLGITRADITAFFNTYYGPGNVAVVIAGDLPESALSTIGGHARHFTDRMGVPQSFEPFKWQPGKVDLKMQYKKLEQVQLSLGFPSYPALHPKLPALNLLNVILGGNMSSRLFISVRERHGLAYTVRSEVSTYEDTGSLRVHAGLDGARLGQAIKLILQELALIRKGVTPKELKDAKECMKGRITLSFEDTLEIAGWYGKQEILHRKLVTPEEKMKQLEKVTLKNIRDVAQEVIVKGNLRAALIGPYKDEKPFRKLLTMSS